MLMAKWWSTCAHCTVPVGLCGISAGRGLGEMVEFLEILCVLDGLRSVGYDSSSARVVSEMNK